MSNDSNEPGNDTAAPAFQVGDRVRYRPLDCVGNVERTYTVNGRWCCNVRVDTDSDGEAKVGDVIEFAARDELTLISRATPAPAPAQTVARGFYYEDDDDVPLATVLCHQGKHADCHNPDCRCSCHPAAESEPATPAPAATAPTLDTHTLALDFREDCSRCCGERGNGECPECDGDGFNIRTLRLSDEAVDRLAGELVKRLPRIVRVRDGARY